MKAITKEILRELATLFLKNSIEEKSIREIKTIETNKSGLRSGIEHAITALGKLVQNEKGIETIIYNNIEKISQNLQRKLCNHVTCKVGAGRIDFRPAGDVRASVQKIIYSCLRSAITEALEKKEAKVRAPIEGAPNLPVYPIEGIGSARIIQHLAIHESKLVASPLEIYEPNQPGFRAEGVPLAASIAPSEYKGHQLDLVVLSPVGGYVEDQPGLLVASPRLI